jgi:hypothetical protein
MNSRRLSVALLLVICVAAIAHDQTPPLPATDLMKEVIKNELADRIQQRKFMYLIAKRDGKQTLTEEQVETVDGPLFRVIAIDGKPLSRDEQQQENTRIDRYLHDPTQQLKLKRAHEEDEQKLENLMRLIPEAFLLDYDGIDGNLVRLKFHPNPSYNPPTYEARVARGLAGTILIDSEQKRMAKFSGQLIDDVQFGYGILGHVDKGGTIEMGRVPVGPSQWKTALINIQLSGRMVFFKTISKQQYETRSDFRQVAGDLSLVDANRLLAR